MNRERTYKTEAIILRRRNFGEADRILTVFTPHRGKLRVRAAGIRKPASRKAGHLELFSRSVIFLAQGREMDVLTQAESLEPHSRLRDDLARSASASYAVELLDRFAPEGNENLAAFELLAETLDALCGEGSPALLLRAFDLHLLDAMGYKPDLFHCVTGREEIQAEDQTFSPILGGVVCPRCSEKTSAGFSISVNALRLLRHLQRNGISAAKELAVQPATLEEAESALQRYIHYLLEQPLKSREFLRELKKRG